MSPLLKLALKNYFSVMLRQLDDLKPAIVVLNVDVFSALYVANILQASQSRVNTAIVLAVDVVQMAIAVDDLRMVMSEIQSLVRLDKFNGSVLDLCVMASSMTGMRKELDRRSSSSRTMSLASKRTITPADGRTVIPPRSEVPAAHPSRLSMKRWLLRGSSQTTPFDSSIPSPGFST
ncbi:hypothetical protein Poli38472_011743 [Pythium oligandrum]|uniref:Uncharacterized protein n=1 Tax=Pythium oligandrum TaxID=41045 RepID=A0A8K1FCB8_PYTOL|nr:hypothetical protein Poli38472_011743 [Pythium oligandrum]|eukprot:TMW58155.1 hypothetical protein Poli38472_011743 [Pythium oligandrum]